MHKLILAFLALPLITAQSLLAATGDTTVEPMGFGTVVINQISPYETHEAVGEWTLVTPENERIEKQLPTYKMEESKAGRYTFFVDPIDGTSASVEFKVNGDIVETIERPQISFVLSDGDFIEITVRFPLTRTGMVSVRSDPLGHTFEIKGPNKTVYSGETPMSYEGVVEGLYTVYFDAIEDCASPRPLSQRLVKDGRINLSMKISCTNIVKDTPQQEKKDERFEFVTVDIDGTITTFKDAPSNAWYAPFVAKVARANIITGYKDPQGIHTGYFGVNDNVTLAQLAKIAHEVAGIDENKIRVQPQNKRARGQWFEKYFASAEILHWRVFINISNNPIRPATRAEVTATLLQALEVRRVWPQGKLFYDVKPTDRYAASIETASIDGMVSGYTDRNGTSTGEFGSDNSVNRAEMAKFVSSAIDLYLVDSPEFSGGSY